MAVIKRYAHINKAANESQNKLDAAEAYITGSLTAASTLHVFGSSQLDGQAKFGNATSILVLAGNAGLKNIDVAIENDEVVGGKLMVSGNITAGGNADFSGTLHAGLGSEIGRAHV